MVSIKGDLIAPGVAGASKWGLFTQGLLIRFRGYILKKIYNEINYILPQALTTIPIIFFGKLSVRMSGARTNLHVRNHVLFLLMFPP